MEYKIGEQVEIDCCYIRHTRGKLRANTTSYPIRYKEWVELNLGFPKIVTLVGIRTLSNGFTEHDPDVGYMYDSDMTFKAALVVDTIHTKPYPVPLSRMVRLDTN